MSLQRCTVWKQITCHSFVETKILPTLFDGKNLDFNRAKCISEDGKLKIWTKCQIEDKAIRSNYGDKYDSRGSRKNF